METNIQVAMGEVSSMNSWDRQRNPETGELEPMLWFGRFDKFYRPMGTERSLLGAINQWRVQTGRKKYRAVSGSWNDAFERWNWKARAELWDIEQRRQRLVMEDEARRDMIQRHIKEAQLLQGVGTKRLRELANETEDISTGEARRLVTDGATMERKARGLPEYLIAIAQMSDEQLAELHGQIFGTETPGDSGTDGDETAWHDVSPPSKRAES